MAYNTSLYGFKSIVTARGASAHTARSHKRRQGDGTTGQTTGQ